MNMNNVRLRRGRRFSRQNEKKLGGIKKIVEKMDRKQREDQEKQIKEL